MNEQTSLLEVHDGTTFARSARPGGTMRSRILLALVVLGAIVGWARCSFNPRVAAPPFDARFVGCFEGAVTDPPGAGTVVVVLEDPVATESVALGGCLRATIGDKTPFVTLAGSVQEEDPELAVLGGLEAGKPGFLTVRVERRPPGFADATEIDVAIEGGDRPFNRATGLVRCAPPPDTCAGLARALAPSPQPNVLQP